MLDAVRAILDTLPTLDYVLVFGSVARGTPRADSDLDLALGLSAPLDAGLLGALLARLEEAAGRPIDIVLMEQAPIPLAYRIFKEGRVLLVHNHPAMVQRKVRAILDYLDFEPTLRVCVDGVLRRAARG